MFATPDAFTAALANPPGPDPDAIASATARNARLTKPAGSLGRLEELAIWFAGWRGHTALERAQVAIFAGNHGIAARGVSAFPPEVTAQMVANFDAGGAAINQLARTGGASFSVHPLELDTPTADITQAPAMEASGLAAALSEGWRAVDPQADVLVVGEMGIGNTTVAAALCAALLGGDGADWTGRGTGVDAGGMARKVAAVDAALAHHAAVVAAGDALEILRVLGGREVAAMAAAMARARMLRIPVILDGFIACSAAAVLHRMDPRLLAHAVAGHCSDEAAHAVLLDRLGKVPLLRLGLRLGEGSGAALALPILRAALACLAGMATFEEARVADG